ncbi:hypothetical protein SUGI_0017780 [Cryptomeria japonica]|nr:hypothetical protein SUGI_0017780 [Cryptomeria japonica]
MRTCLKLKIKVGGYTLDGIGVHIIDWKPNFNPRFHSLPENTVWLRLYNCPSDYWHIEIIKDICKELGTFVSVDDILEDRVWGCFIRICINTSQISSIPEEVKIIGVGKDDAKSLQKDIATELATSLSSVPNKAGDFSVMEDKIISPSPADPIVSGDLGKKGPTIDLEEGEIDSSASDWEEDLEPIASLILDNTTKGFGAINDRMDDKGLRSREASFTIITTKQQLPFLGKSIDISIPGCSRAVGKAGAVLGPGEVEVPPPGVGAGAEVEEAASLRIVGPAGGRTGDQTFQW